MPRHNLSGCRILVVEDDPLIALMLEEILTLQGCTVIGPFSRLAEALPVAEAEALDAGVLDVKLGDNEQSYPIAEVLTSRGIPVVLATGYGDALNALARSEWVVCGKPFS